MSDNEHQTTGSLAARHIALDILISVIDGAIKYACVADDVMGSRL